VDPPTVYIEEEPFFTMVLSSVETFKRECFGYIFGRKPSRTRNNFIITSAVAVQLAKKRRNKEIEQSKLSERNMKEFFKKYPAIFPVIGDFHSHPEWGSHKREPTLSSTDMKDMLRGGCPLSVVIKISSINKDRILWQGTAEGGIRGSLGKYKFHINILRVTKEGNGDLKEECFFIQAPAALKSLNRALGYT